MSDFLIGPRYVYGQYVCCNSSGVSSAVVAPISSSINYAAENDGSPYKWKLSNGVDKTGGVGYGVCCGSKYFNIDFTCKADYSSTSPDFAAIRFNVFVSGYGTTLVIFQISKNQIGNPNSDYNVKKFQDGNLVSNVNVQNLSEITHQFTVTSNVTPSACSGSLTTQGGINVLSGLSVTASIAAQFSIT